MRSRWRRCALTGIFRQRGCRQATCSASCAPSITRMPRSEESAHFILASTTADIHRAKREGKIAIVICLEGGAPLEQEISYLRNFYRLGLRCLGLTHDVRNEIGDGVRERSAGGLTHFGVKCRGRMQSARHRRRRVAPIRQRDGGCACGQLAADHRLALQRARALSPSPQLDRRIDTSDSQEGRRDRFSRARRFHQPRARSDS